MNQVMWADISWTRLSCEFDFLNAETEARKVGYFSPVSHQEIAMLLPV